MFYNAQSDLIERQIEADLVLCDPDGTEFHVLNAVAIKIFQLCDGSHTPEQMAEALVESFSGVEYDQAYADVARILNVLEEKKLIISKQ